MNGDIAKRDLVAAVSDAAYALELVSRTVASDGDLVRDEMHPVVFDVAIAIARAHETDESKRHVDAIYAPYGFLIRLNDGVENFEHLTTILDTTSTYVERVAKLT